MKSLRWTRGLLPLAMAIAITACSSTRTVAPYQGRTATAVKPVINPAIRYFPTDSPSTAIASIERESPKDINVDQPFDYTIKIHNLSDAPLLNVQLQEFLSSNFKLMSSTPSNTMSENGKAAVWNINKIGGNETQVITVTGMATAEGTFKQCADLSYQRYLCQQFNASSPALALTKSAPATAIVGELIPMRLVVSNPGTGMAKNVIVNDPLPSGMITTNGRQSIQYNVGDLESKESKAMSFSVTADRTGKFTNTATATATGLSAEATAITVITQPQLQITKDATERQYSGRNITYTIKVTNVGDASAINAVVTDPLPAGTSFIKASDGGMRNGNQIVWNLGTMAPNASKTITALVKADVAGTITNTACVDSDNTGKVCDDASTRVIGISALLLEAVDLNDPIEIGHTETYIITATNQGTAPDTNIKLTFEFEDNMKYINANGPTSASVSGNIVTFSPLAALNAKAQAKWTINLTAQKVGDVRCKVQLQSDNLKRPVMETEATTIY